MDKVGDQVTVCVANEIVKLMLVDVADACVALAAIVAVKVQVPAVTNVTTPVEEPTVQTDVVELE
jgi:hypothetical protein